MYIRCIYTVFAFYDEKSIKKHIRDAIYGRQTLTDCCSAHSMTHLKHVINRFRSHVFPLFHKIILKACMYQNVARLRLLVFRRNQFFRTYVERIIKYLISDVN